MLQAFYKEFMVAKILLCFVLLRDVRLVCAVISEKMGTILFLLSKTFLKNLNNINRYSLIIQRALLYYNHFFFILEKTRSDKKDTISNSSLVFPKSVSAGRYFMK